MIRSSFLLIIRMYSCIWSAASFSSPDPPGKDLVQPVDHLCGIVRMTSSSLAIHRGR
jgi:hypothetical protein